MIHMKIRAKISIIYDRILDILTFLSGILLAFSALSVSFGIFSRYFLSRPISWVTEISEYIILYITFLVAAWVLRQEGHVKMDIILNQLNPKVQSLTNMITSIFCSISCLILTSFGIKVSWDLYKAKAFTYTILELPKFIFTSVIFLGSFMLFIQFIRKAQRHLRRWKGLRD